MKLMLTREKIVNGAILGTLMYKDLFLCYTLENEEKSIPVGEYKIDFCMSPKFNRNLPLLYNSEVPASRGIRMHEGNTKRDSVGCVLCGNTVNLKNGSIGESKKCIDMIEHLFENNALIYIKIR